MQRLQIETLKLGRRDERKTRETSDAKMSSDESQLPSNMIACCILRIHMLKSGLTQNKSWNITYVFM